MNWEQEYLWVQQMTLPSEQLEYLEFLIDSADREEDWVWLYVFATFRNILLYEDGKYHEFLGSFEWCLDFCERNHSLFHAEQILVLLWQYKWALELYLQFPETPRDVIEESLEDYRFWLQRYNFSYRSFHFLSYQTYTAMHDEETATVHYDLWRSSEQDENLDCLSCEYFEEMLYEIQNGSIDKGLLLLEKIEELNGCSSIPYRMYASLLLPLYSTHPDRAKHFHEIGYFYSFQHPRFLRLQSFHVLYLLSISIHKAEKAWIRAYESAAMCESEYDQFVFLLCSWCLFSLSPELAKKHEFDLEKLSYMVQESADAFDVRNGNDGCHRWINTIFEYVESIAQKSDLDHLK